MNTAKIKKITARTVLSFFVFCFGVLLLLAAFCGKQYKLYFYEREINHYLKNKTCEVYSFGNIVQFAYRDAMNNKKIVQINDAKNANKLSDIKKSVRSSIIYTIEAEATDEIIRMASESDQSDKIYGISVHLSKDGSEEDNSDSLDVSDVDLSEAGIMSIYQIKGSMFRIMIQTDMSDTDFEILSDGLTARINDTYNQPFSFQIERLIES